MDAKKVQLKENEKLEYLSEDLTIIQHKDGYCFTSDAIDLANFVNVKNAKKVVDLCSGSGVIGLILHKKLRAKETHLVEIQKRLAGMSKRSVQSNNLTHEVAVINAPLQNISAVIGKGVFDVVVCNPPYKKKSSSLINVNQEIAIAKHEITITLEEIIKESNALLRFGGAFYIVNKEERLAEIIYLMKKYNIQPKILKIKQAKGLNVIFIKGVRGGKSGLKIHL